MEIRKYERKRNAVKGALTGTLSQMVNIIAPFFIKTAIIRILGVEYNGLNSLFVSILQVLNLAELGVGTALVFSMYKPIAENDDEKICALMKLYKVYYRIIGLIVLLVGLLLTPFLKFLIKSDLPDDVNLYILYFLNLFATVVSYWLFAYKNSILSAFQKTYVINTVGMIVNIIKYTAQLVSLLIFQNYYVFLVISIVCQILNNIVTAIVANKMYPEYVPKGEIPKDERKKINSKVYNLFAAKVCGVVTNSADSLVISSFLGLTVLGIYNNYYYILSSVMATFSIFYSAIRAGVGNALITESPQKNEDDFFGLTFLLSLIVSVSSSCFLTLYQPFIKIWVGEQNMLGFSSVILLCMYFVFYEYPIFWATYKDAAGKWREDRTRSIVAPIFNTIVNIWLVNLIGINGVLLSTVLTYSVLSGPWLLRNIRKYVIEFDFKRYVLKYLQYIICITICSIVSYSICLAIDGEGFWGLIVNFIVSVTVSIVVFILSFRLTKEYDYLRRFIKGLLKKRG